MLRSSLELSSLIAPGAERTNKHKRRCSLSKNQPRNSPIHSLTHLLVPHSTSRVFFFAVDIDDKIFASNNSRNFSSRILLRSGRHRTVKADKEKSLDFHVNESSVGISTPCRVFFASFSVYGAKQFVLVCVCNQIKSAS